MATTRTNVAVEAKTHTQFAAVATKHGVTHNTLLSALLRVWTDLDRDKRYEAIETVSELKPVPRRRKAAHAA